MQSPYHVIGDPQTAAGPFIFTCEHATNRLVDVQATEADRRLLDDHWGYDIGARWVTEALVEQSDSVGVVSDFSRLLIDPNRALDSETLIVERCGGQPVSFNQELDQATVARRIAELHVPYHEAIDRVIKARLARGAAHLVSVHSFTPEWFGKPRPMDVGVLFDEHVVHAEKLAAALADEGFAVALNAPYSGAGGLFVYSIMRHGRANGLPFIELEVRQDLIRVEAEARAVALRIGRALQSFAP